MSILKKKNLILLALVFCCCFIAVGYFVVVQAIIVKGNIKIEESRWKVKFKDVQTKKLNGSAENYKDPTLSDYVINVYAKFKDPKDSAEYEIIVRNDGNIDAELSKIFFTPADSQVLEYKISGLNEGMVLKKGKEKKFKLKITYVGNNTNQENNGGTSEYTMKLVLNWKQAN